MKKISIYFSHDRFGSSLLHALSGSAGLRIIGVGLGFLIGIQLARGLGASGYGVYGIVMSIISIITIPTEFGLPHLVTREIAAAQVRNENKFILDIWMWANKTVILLSLGIAFTGFVVCLLLKEWFNYDVAVALLAGLLLVPIVALGNLSTAALRGLQKIILGQLPDVVLRPAFFSILLFFIMFITEKLNPSVAITMQVISSALTLMISNLMLKNYLPVAEITSVCTRQVSRWWRSALPMALSEGMRILTGNLSILILGLLSSTAMVGVFRVASSMGILMSMPVTIVHVVSAPIFSRLHAEGDRKRLQLMLNWIVIAMVVSVAVLIFPFVFWGTELISAVFGAEFFESNVSLLVLSIGTLVGSAFGAGAILLNMAGYELRVTRAFGYSLAMLVLLSPLFIFYWGSTGAALANSIAYILWSGLMWLDARKLLKYDTSILPVFKRFLNK